MGGEVFQRRVRVEALGLKVKRVYMGFHCRVENYLHSAIGRSFQSTALLGLITWPSHLTLGNGLAVFAFPEALWEGGDMMHHFGDKDLGPLRRRKL